LTGALTVILSEAKDLVLNAPNHSRQYHSYSVIFRFAQDLMLGILNRSQ